MYGIHDICEIYEISGRTDPSHMANFSDAPIVWSRGHRPQPPMVWSVKALKFHEFPAHLCVGMGTVGDKCFKR